MDERSQKILIADPDPGILQSMTIFLKENYSICEASNALQVLERVENEEMDLLIIDAHLEGIYLFDMLRMIREAAPELPIIVMYIYLGKSQQIEENIREIVDACVIKPFRNDDLLKTIETLIRKRR